MTFPLVKGLGGFSSAIDHNCYPNCEPCPILRDIPDAVGEFVLRENRT